jgi:ATP-dependent DNA helicase RecG
MNPAITKLTKFLRLEAERGFDNRAVLGGLDRMLKPWQEEARGGNLPEPLIEAVTSRLRDYGRLSPKSRSEVLQGLWRRLQQEAPDLPGLEFTAPAETADGAPDAEPAEKDISPEPSAAAEESPPAEASRTAEVAAEPEEPSETASELEQNAAAEEPPTKKSKPEGPPAAMGAPLTTVQGIGPKSAKTLSKLGLHTLGDLLWHLPRRYDDFSQLETINRLWYGQEVTIIANVEKCEVREVRGGRMKLTEVIVGDGTGSLRVTWFNQPWIANKLKPGRPVVLSGKVDQYLGHLTMTNPEWEPLERKQLHTNRIVPVYPLTAGVSGKWLRRVIHSVVQRLAPRVPDPLPEAIQKSANLVPLSTALQQVHFPDSQEKLHAAQHRLAFDEMFMLQLGVLRQKREWEQNETRPLPVEDSWIDNFVRTLPYELTKAQDKALDEIRHDLSTTRPMNRLLQGDVGSGKTVVAAAAIGIAAHNASQSAFMAPTSILAEQHFRTLRAMLPQSAAIPAEKIRLLIGSTSEAEKSEIRAGLESGQIQVVIGTHALIEGPVQFKDLGLAIVDEQHRFGVEQRAELRAKGESPNLLIMTATPIPRSLALTVYGDLDLTLLDEMPPGRQHIETRVLLPNERTRAHAFIRSQLELGHQAFIIYPLVEESESMQTKAAVDEYERLQTEVFPDYKVGLLHGRLKPDEKESVMERFHAGEIDVLVSTSVVEVGVDVPNATVMLIEGANHFGLAQLHQFRGRVGRGVEQSYCLMIPDAPDDAANERLKAMQLTNDGFVLAERDLEQRGPGDFLGTRQSGFAELRTARLTDVRLIETARREATHLFEQDPGLTEPEHAQLAEALNRFWTPTKGEIS